MFDSDPIGNLNVPDSGHLSVEEVLLDKDVSSLHTSLETSKSGTMAHKLISGAIVLSLLFLVVRAYGLQVAKGDYYRLAAEGNRIRNQIIFAPRGLITDRYGEVLARNLPNFELVAIPHDLPDLGHDLPAVLTAVSEYVEIDTSGTLEMLSKLDRDLIEPVTIVPSLTQDQALQIERILAETTGLKIQNTPVREYIDGPVFANVLGYVGKLNEEEWLAKRSEGYFYNDTTGKTAIEYIYEEHLRGVHGRIEMEVDAKGNLQKELQRVAPKAGRDLKLTIDAGLQKTLYESLEKTLKARPSATGAAAIAIDPRTGEILSLVSLPSYDNNLFSRGITKEQYQSLLNDKQKPMFNRPIAGSYPPGSTLKAVVAAAALEEGVITDKTIINDQGFISYGTYRYHGWNRQGLGRLDVYGAIARSSDPFFYVVGGGHDDYKIDGLGIDRLVKYFADFGLGSKLGIVLPGESPAFLPTPEWKKKRFAGTDEERWYIGNTYHLSIGQGYLLTTPLQVAAYTAAFANGGQIMKPVLTDYETRETVFEVDVSDKNIEIINKALREVVLSGSGMQLLDLPVSSAGKTGTSQFDPNDPARTHAWYTAFAPYENPEVVITVLVEAGGEGHQVAVPVVKDALRFWAENRYNHKR